MAKTKRNRWKLISVEQRFWAKVDKEGPLPLHRPDLGRCWLWTGSCTDKGYGYFRVGDQRQYRAHRWSYEHFISSIPEGTEPDHLCRVRCCVNFDHLEPVTHKVNILRGEGLAAEEARRNYCYRGHEFTPENTRFTKKGARRCCKCRAIQHQQSKARVRV